MVNMQENVLLRRGADGRAHIPPMPFWLGIVRIAQFILTLVIMILAAYASSVFGAGYFVGYGLSFFLFFWTILVLAYIIITPLFMPKIYVYWVQLLLEFKTTVFWLATFALLAEEAAAWGSVEGLLNYPVVDPKGNTTYVDYWPGWKSAIDSTKAAAGLGALTWLLFVVSLVTFAIACYKHYKAKAPMFSSSAAAPATNDAEKAGPTVVQQPVELNEYQQQPAQHNQQTHPTQPVYQQPSQI